MYRHARLLNHVGRDYGEVLSIYVDTDLKKNWTNGASAYVAFRVD